MISTARIHAQLSMSATEDLSGRESDGKRDLARASSQKQELRDNIKERTQRAIELESEMEEAGDTSFWQDVGDFFTGRDREGEVAVKQHENQAHVERGQNELEIVKAEAKDIMAELKDAQGDMQGTHGALQEILQDDQQTKQMSLIG